MSLTKVAEVAAIVAALVAIYGLLESKLPGLKLPSHLWMEARGPLIAFLLGTAILIGLWQIEALQTAALQCPPSQQNWNGFEGLVIEAGSSKVVRFSKSIFNPPGTTPAIAARVQVTQGTILWSDDGSEPSREATKSNPPFWVCREKIPKFRAMLGGPELAALNVSYVW